MTSDFLNRQTQLKKELVHWKRESNNVPCMQHKETEYI